MGDLFAGENHLGLHHEVIKYSALELFLPLQVCMPPSQAPTARSSKKRKWWLRLHPSDQCHRPPRQVLTTVLGSRDMRLRLSGASKKPYWPIFLMEKPSARLFPPGSNRPCRRSPAMLSQNVPVAGSMAEVEREDEWGKSLERERNGWTFKSKRSPSSMKKIYYGQRLTK